MNKIFLSLILPVQAFCCSHCVDVLEAQKELIQEQIQRIDDSYIHDEEILIYLFGQYDALQQAIFLIEATSTCP